MVGRKRVLGVLFAVAFVCTAFFAFAGTAFAQQRNPECLSCHQSMTDWSVFDVDRSTACSKCHAPGLLGTHPRHNAGGNCGAVCHLPNKWGDSSRYAVPAWVGPQGAFATSTSVDASASVIHAIHSQTRWMSTVNTPSEKCASCHAVASCSACHDYTKVSPKHADHSASGNASYTAQPAWTGSVAHGVLGGDMTMETVFEVTNQCATAGCHDVAGMAASAPVQRESHSHLPIPSSPVTDTVTYTPRAWPTLSSTNYTSQRANYANIAGYTLSSTFPASVIEVVAATDPYFGQAEVWIDGTKRADIDLYAPVTGYQKVVYRSGQLSAGNHTIEIRAKGTKNPLSRGAYVVIDGFRAYETPSDSAAPLCTSCHPDKTASHGFTFDHIATSASFTGGTYAGFACTQCHGDALVEEHRRSSSKIKDNVCTQCHTTYAPYLDPNAGGTYTRGCAWGGEAGSLGCHQVAGQVPHNFIDGDHTPTTAASEAGCRGCHAGDLDVVHDNSVTTNGFEPDCLSCHGATSFPATKSCLGGCHELSGVDSMEAHPYLSAKHVGAVSQSGVSNTGGLACSTCHYSTLELYPEHSRTSAREAGGGAVICSSCHDKSYLPRPWNGQCTACHTTGKAPAPHSAYAAKHDYSLYSAANFTSCGGAVCHDVASADVIHDASLPGGGQCTSCHVPGAGVPTKKLCTDCHSSHTLTAAHNASAYPAAAECLRCHQAAADIRTSHSGGCVTCHNVATGQLTDYLSGTTGGHDRYSALCTTCHTATQGASGAAVLGTGYSPVDPAHYAGTEVTHTASSQSGTFDLDGAGGAYAAYACSSCHSLEMKPEHIAKTYAAFVGVPSTTYPDKCVACHVQRVQTLPGGTWNKTCDQCHSTKHVDVNARHNASSVVVSTTGGKTALAACGSGDCHNVANLAAIHNQSVTSNDGQPGGITNCNTCHTPAAVQAQRDCGLAGCHPGYDNHVGDHGPAANDQCGACHESGDVRDVHATCAVCHANPTYPGLTTTKTTVCTDCHNPTGIFAKDYTLPDGHYTGTEATHLSAANGTYSGYQCTQCHQLDMKDEHAKASVAFVTYETTTTVVGKCVVCHEAKVDPLLSAWDKKCISCHPSTHTARTAKHNASLSNADCGGSGCHAVNDVALIHNNSVTAVTTADTLRCLVCHTSNDSVPAPIDCGAVGCHAGMEHGHSLNLTGSNYNNTTNAGCTNAGPGCHGDDASEKPDYANAYHPANGCQSGVCHASASQPNDAFNNPQTCQNCHGGRATAPLNYVGAPDVAPLAAATTATAGGHYDQTIHNLAASSATMSVGGHSYAKCSDCHGAIRAGGLNGLWNQHQTLQGYGNTTCRDCHSFNAQVAAYIKSRPAGDCVDCHSLSVMGAQYVMHATDTVPPAAGIVASTPEFQCGDPGCHATSGLDLHTLHRGDGIIVPSFSTTNGVDPYDPARCTTVCHPAGQEVGWVGPKCERRLEPQCVDCHDPLMQGWKPWAKSCGINGDCHITLPHSLIGPAHSVTALSQACVDCHETTDMRVNHGYPPTEDCASNNVCHDLDGQPNPSGSGTFVIAGKKECVDCHNAAIMGGRDHAPHDPNHYIGSELTHTANYTLAGNDGGYGRIGSVVATESFNSATWPASWNRNSTTLVVTSNSAPLFEGTHYAQVYTTSATRSTNYFQRTFDTAAVASPTVEFHYTTTNFVSPDYARLEYSTDGTNFIQVWNTTATQTTWTKVGPLSVPRSSTLTLRFSASTNANNSDRFRVDSVVLKPGDGPDIACAQCHQMELKPEHFKASSDATRVPSIYPDKCVDCHEQKADLIAGSWNRSCLTPECHGGNHNASTAKHDATSISPTCGGSGCHFLKDVAVIHNNSVVGNSTVTTCANTCHTSNANAPETASCGGTGPGTCHNGMQPHEHELDYDGSLFNATAMTGCVQSGAGCHGTSTSTNYAQYHPNSGCLDGACHAGNTTQQMPEFNNPNTCMNCHGGGPVQYHRATDRVPVTGVTPDGHYPVSQHTAAPASRTASLTAGGAASARCNQCHDDAGTGGASGLYPQHQGLPTLGNTSCVDCHNYNASVTAQITSSWTNDTCADCHNATALPSYVQHSASLAPAAAAIEAQGANTCVTVGCHQTLDLHTLHRNASNATGGCNLTNCHDFTKQALKPTKKSCGTGGTCHATGDPHNPLAHQITIDTGLCTRCHEGQGGVVVTDVREVYSSSAFGVNSKAHAGCSSCHNAGLNLGGQTDSVTDCVYCHTTGKAGTHAYTPYDPNHYYAASHDASQATGANYGTSGYSKTLADFHGTSLNFERACTTCHTIDLKTEHNKTSVAFNLGGKADKCVACHELKVDGWANRWAGGCGGEANSCHNMTNLHSDWSTKHNASTQVMSAPGSSFTLGSTAGVATDNFGTSTTWPAAWTRNSTTYVTVQTGSARSGAAAQIGVNTTRTEYNFYRTTAFDLASYGAGTVRFWYQVNVSDTADFLVCEYSTTSGTTGYTELFRVNTDALSWTQSPALSIPGGGNVWIRFRGTFNATGEYGRVDDLQVDGVSSASFGAALPANSTAAASCQNNPNGTECHNVADVANIHSRTPNFGCPICHTGTAQHATQLNCQASGCHTGVNVDNHNTTWHESTISNTTLFGTGFAASWCTGCHDDSIDNEHFVLGAYASQPCSMCHKKSANSAAPVSVTSADTSATIHGNTTAGNQLCTDCHKTVTKATPHVQRFGWNGLPNTGSAAVGGVQFNDTWSGHRSYDTMPGQKTSFSTAVDGTGGLRTWSLPSTANYISNWSAATESSTMMVTCVDCHGSVTGATGPHGGSMKVSVAAGYTNNYSTGGTYINSTSVGGNGICAKCHNVTNLFNGTANGSVHNRSDHKGTTGGRCINCHVKIPHAWKRPRLIGYRSDPAPYASLTVNSITDRAYTPTGWSRSYCGVTGCSSHGTDATTPLWP